MNTSVVVTGVGVALPRVHTAQSLLVAVAHNAEPVDPATRVGKKGLRYKDRATQLAYCATDVALRDAGLLDGTELTVPAETIGVVASSNLGNVDTVVRALDTIAVETVTGTSPMDLPNASSNVIASSAAIRFGLQGPNLMVCNGSTSGLDAVHWARTMVATGRARRVLVVGVEPDTEAVRVLLPRTKLLDGAVAIIVEDAQAAEERGANVLAEIGDYARTGSLTDTVDRLSTADRPALWHVPERGAAPVPAQLLAGVPRYDLAHTWGAASGALGVLQCAAAVGWFAGGGAGPVFATAGDERADAVAGLVLRGRS